MTGMSHWLSTAAVAELQPNGGVDERTIRRRVSKGKYGEENSGWRRAGTRIQIALTALASEERASYYANHPHLRVAPPIDASTEPLDAPPPPSLSFDNVPNGVPQKKRAIERKAICDSFEQFLAEWDRNGGSFTKVKERWCAMRKISADSLDRWMTAYRAHGIDGLVDRYDRSAHRGQSKVPQRVREFFIARYTDGTIPTRAMAMMESRLFAEAELKLDLAKVADDAFDRVIRSIPESVIRRTRGDQDTEEKVIYTLRRDHNFPAHHIVVTDHHLTDRWVHCGEGGYVLAGDRLVQVPAGRICGPEGCRAGHRVWVTMFMDVASRKCLAWIISLGYPNSDTIRRGVKLLVERYGIPNIIYCDNGKDFKSAFGRAIRRKEALPVDEDLTSNLLASLGVRVMFAIPRRARSKNIERLFKTWLTQIWQGHPDYAGALGKRTEAAEALRKEPHKLLSLEEFTDELELQISLYNLAEGHRGQGMRGRSPEAVFDTTRIPHRKPESEGFAYAFWSWYGRLVHAGGTLIVGEDRYVLDPIAGGSVIGKQVQLLVDPDDVRHGIVLSGCEHTSSKHARSQVLRCQCSGKGALLCEARLDGLSSYDDSAIMQESVREASRINRELRRQVRTFSSDTARQDLRLFKHNRLGLLRAVRDRRLASHQQQMAAAGGGSSAAPSVTVLLPQSQIARRVGEYRTLMTSGVLSSGSLPPIDDERLDQLLTSARSVTPFPVPAAEMSAGEIDDERARVRRARKLRDGVCTEGECSEPITRAIDDAEHCGEHWLVLFGSELEPTVRTQIQMVMREEL